MKSRMAAAVFVSMVLTGLGCVEERPSEQDAAGREKSTKTEVLEAGAELLQPKPFDDFDVYLVGFHPMKEDPSIQMEAHHFCRQVNEDFAQCVLFDGNDEDGKMNGIEYIISERLFEQLDPAERSFWHPHNFEILSGQLVAPGIPMEAELELMRGKMNSYGKTFHFWRTGRAGEEGESLPLGPPMLAWSFNRMGEAEPGLVPRRDQAMEIDSEGKRVSRQDLVELARPQYGVDALRGQLPRETTLIEGVRDAGEARE